MDKLVDGIVLTSIEVTVDPVKVATLIDYIEDFEDLIDYTEDFEDIDLNYPTVDELDNMDSFLSHYKGFVDRVEGLDLATSNIIALYTVYINIGRV